MDAHSPPEIAHLVALLPPNARSLIEVGSRSGVLARRYKHIYPACFYQGVEHDTKLAALARQHCDVVHNANIETVGDAFFTHVQMADCWIFNGALERLREPWRVLARIRKSIAADACIVALVPNCQHWMAQIRLNRGDVRYENAGALPPGQLRWFSRATLYELFAQTGFKVVRSVPLNDDQLGNEQIKAALRQMALHSGADPEQALRDALPSHLIIKAVPA